MPSGGSPETRSHVPAASTRGLKRSLSAADDDGPGDEDVNDREKEIAKERAEAWGQAQALRRKWVSASCIKADRMTKEHLDNWWGKQTAANQFQGSLASRIASSGCPSGGQRDRARPAGSALTPSGSGCRASKAP